MDADNLAIVRLFSQFADNKTKVTDPIFPPSPSPSPSSFFQLFDNKKVEAVRLAIDHVQMAATQFEAFALATLTDFWVGKEAAELSVMLHRHLQSSRVAHEFARLDTDEMVALFAAIMVPGRRGSKLEHSAFFPPLPN